MTRPKEPPPAASVISAGEPRAVLDPRILAAWHEWLRALATDAEAAIAAAHVYEALAPEARDAWLDALAEDAPRVGVPLVAVYAPLLAVELDPTRRDRMEVALDHVDPPSERRAYRGIAADGSRVVALVAPLYLRFVAVLACRYHPDRGFAWVRHDPIQKEADAPGDGAYLEDVALEATPLKPVIEELAHAVLAQRRSGKELPRPLVTFADLFNAELEGESS
jgi:hypothetical protein